MIVVHTTYYLDQEASSFLHTTTHRRPNIPTLERFALPLNILSISDLRGDANISKEHQTCRFCFVSSSAGRLCEVSLFWTCATNNGLSLSSQRDRNTIHNTQHTLCIAHKSPSTTRLESTRLDWTDRWWRCASTSFSLYLYHVALLMLSWCSSRTDVLFFPFQATKRNEVGPWCELLFADQWIGMCVCECVCLIFGDQNTMPYDHYGSLTCSAALSKALDSCNWMVLVS